MKAALGSMLLLFCLSLAFLTGFSFGASVASAAIDSRELAKEIQPLLRKMDRQDPARLTMNLRLADLLFQSAVEIDKKGGLGAKEEHQLESLRRESAQIYELCLSGLNGVVKAPSGVMKVKIQFQLARLYNDLGHFKKAEAFWWVLARQDEELAVQREAALRLAETLEVSQQAKDLMEAGQLYDRVLKNCPKPNLCGYVEYRRAWVHYRLGNAEKGLTLLLASLDHAEANSRAEILRDLLIFLAHSERPVSQAVAILTKWETETKDATLLEGLAANYHSIAQNEKYYALSKILQARTPQKDRLIRLIDHEYGLGQLSEVRNSLKKLGSPQYESVGFASDEKKAEAEKILFRLIFQWDGERKTRAAEFTPLLLSGAVVFIDLFPESTEHQKVVDGWLAATPNSEAKLKQVEIWRQGQVGRPASPRLRHLDQVELSLLQERKDWARVAVVSERLSGVVAKDGQQNDRKIQYARGKALYELKRFEEALKLFQELAKIPSSAGDLVDQEATFSQNLALDILAQEKKYDQVISQSQSWTEHPQLVRAAAQDGALHKELAQMTEVAHKATFAKAVELQNADSLKTFKAYCLQNEYLPQSCENARGLALKLKDEDSLLQIVAHTSGELALAQEMEAAGRFVDSAKVYEKLQADKSVSIKENLRTALLFEMAGEQASRDRVLKKVAKQVSARKDPLPEAEEALVYETLLESELLTAKSLQWAWRSERRERLAADLLAAGKGESDSAKILLKTCTDRGPIWQKLHLEELQSLAKKQKVISIVGRNSERAFKRRVQGLKQLSEASQCYLKGSQQPVSRVVLLLSVSRSFAEFADEILDSPVPDDLDKEVLQQVQAQLKEMAEPFREQSRTWEQQAQVAEQSLPQPLGVWEPWQFDLKSSSVASAQGDASMATTSRTKTLLLALRKDPFAKENWSQLKAHFDETGQKRLAAYLDGRVQEIGNE